ncbi:hypothetical protein [Streptomyces sp. NBC_00932]|uniref:hypothetical protein n=1 Tax=Streptomyces sp. NBC_00932 TaxID=2903690 RepID=UPI00386ECA72|nr:hypothetical protein OG221_27900 [Streptomyces sp. NBC_00932]
MPDEPTLGEVMRRLEDVRTDLKEDIRETGLRLDSKVSLERYQLEQAARDESMRLLIERVKGIEETRKEQEKGRAADRRLILTGLIVPVLLVLVQVYLSTKGAAS